MTACHEYAVHYVADARIRTRRLEVRRTPMPPRVDTGARPGWHSRVGPAAGSPQPASTAHPAPRRRARCQRVSGATRWAARPAGRTPVHHAPRAAGRDCPALPAAQWSRMSVRRGRTIVTSAHRQRIDSIALIAEWHARRGAGARSMVCTPGATGCAAGQRCAAPLTQRRGAPGEDVIEARLATLPLTELRAVRCSERTITRMLSAPPADPLRYQQRYARARRAPDRAGRDGERPRARGFEDARMLRRLRPGLREPRHRAAVRAP